MKRLLEDAYAYALAANETYERYQDDWEYLLESYVGGKDYRRAAHLTKYQLETGDEYQARLDATPLENHAKSVISTYTSFLFKEGPTRDYGVLETDPALSDFLRDADHDGRSLDSFMKEVSVWSSVFGHCFILVSKPDIGAQTRAEELDAGVRPYVSVLTPLVVTDWSWSRSATGKYTLDYIKYIEDVNGDITVVREWSNDRIITHTVNTGTHEVIGTETEVNQLGIVPVIIAYNQRSVVRGIGVSDIYDIADQQRKIYNELSEIEQSIRLNGHPALVKTPSAEAVGGAGAIISMSEDQDPGLKPYLLDVKSDISQIYESINHSVEAIDKMANTGAVRATESRTLSGVAMETEFSLLNAKLSEKARNIELAEEGIWKMYAFYQGLKWDGTVMYPDNFTIRDKDREIQRLKVAREITENPVLLREIDEELAELLGYDELEDDEAEEMQHPTTIPGEDRSKHIQEMIMEGYTDQQMLALHPEISQADIDLAKRELLDINNQEGE